MLSLDWGYDFMVPINNRMKKLYPTLTQQELDFLNTMCYHTVQPFAWQRFYEVHESGDTTYQALCSIKEEFPWITPENLNTLEDQGAYYAKRKNIPIRYSLTQTDHSWKSTIVT